MNYSNYKISLDMHDASSQVSLNVKRGDTSRRILAVLTENGMPYQISPECTAVFTATKPDGKILYNDCSIEGSVIIYAMTEQTTAVAGWLDCEIKLYGADGGLITSPSFTVIVNTTVYNEGDEVESSSEFSALTQLVSEASVLIDEVERKLEAGELNGKDGFSPIVDVEPVTNGHRISITDANGTHTFYVMDGEGGGGSGGGSDGVGILEIRLKQIAATGNTYTIYLTDGSSYDFTAPAGPEGDDGYTPVKNVDYFDGEDGFSPIVSVSKINGGHTVAITDANGTKTFDVLDGTSGGGGEGGGGADGVTFYPSIDSEGNLSWTNDGGLTNPDPVNIMGEDGDDGVGISSVEQTTTSTADGGNNVLTIRLSNGTTKTFNVKNGSKGSPGTSPSISVSANNGGHTVAITDADGTKTFDVLDGGTGRGISGISYNTSTNQWTITYTDGTSSTVTGPTIPSTNVAFGQGYATCSTTASTAAKTASLSGYVLKSGGVVAVRFTYAVPASATLNINSTGAKYMYHKNAYIKAGVINAGDVATFMYDGSYYRLLSVDRDDTFSGDYNDLINKPTIPSAYTHPTSHPASMITGLASVATSGSYNDLADKPSIPSAYTHPSSHAASMITAGTFAGAVVANSSGQDAATSLLRNSKLVSADTDPTVNGEINWVYG